MSNQMPRKSLKRIGKKSKGEGAVARLIPPGRALQFQKVFQYRIPGTTFTLQTAAGTIATVNNVNVGALINSFSTRFGNTFREYRIIKAKFSIYPILNGQGGINFAYINESDSTTPTLALAQNSSGALKFINNMQGSGSNGLTLTWRLRDIGEAGWFPTSNTTQNYCYMMMYTDSASLGQTNNSVITDVVEPELTVEFRGMK